MHHRFQENFKPELLAPAGNFEGFIGCVNAGCDAVYLGGSKYSARAYADNFSDEEIVKAIKYAHIFGVKVYLTVNTLIKQREMDDAVEFVRPFAEAGLDACIVQDIGLAKRLMEEYPAVEYHTSTQGFVTGIDSARYYKNLGASRVVLAREMTLDEIIDIKKNVDIELETFIHGAMCYCFSGQCLFSSSYGGRSGNRGRCAGPCRLPYGNDEYILSLKDQFTLSILPKLLEAGIDSLKIEGRMKKPEYAAFVTAMYRKYIDLYYSKRPYIIEKKDLEDLHNMYLRSETGTGYYDKAKGRDMVTLSNPAYNGSSDELMQAVRKAYIEKPLKTKILGYFYAHEGENIILTLSRGESSVSVTGDICDKALNRATTVEEIKKNLMKLGNTPYEFEDIIFDVSEFVFVPAGKINDLRRRAVEELINEV